MSCAAFSEDEQIAPLPAKVVLKSNWDDEDVDENEIKDSWEDDDDDQPAPVFKLFILISGLFLFL